MDRGPAQVALDWVAKRPGVSATLIGATKTEQLKGNLAALDFDVPSELRAELDRVSEPESTTPYLYVLR